MSDAAKTPAWRIERTQLRENIPEPVQNKHGVFELIYEEEKDRRHDAWWWRMSFKAW